MRRALAALALALAACAALGAAAHPHRCAVIPEQAQLVPRDRPLMTEQEREWARQSGVGTYVWDGVNVVDEGLPEEYWRPPWHE